MALGSSPSWVLHVCDSEQLILYYCILVVYLTLWYSFQSLDCCYYACLLTKLGLCPLLYNSGVAQITYYLEPWLYRVNTRRLRLRIDAYCTYGAMFITGR